MSTEDKNGDFLQTPNYYVLQNVDILSSPSNSAVTFSSLETQNEIFISQTTSQASIPTTVDPVAELLRSWNLYDDIYEILKAKYITIEGLKYIKERHLDEIFAGRNLNAKIIFEQKLGCWQNTFGIYNLRPHIKYSEVRNTNAINQWLCTTGSSSPSSTVTLCANDINVADIIEKSEQGKCIMKNYEEKGSLTPANRTLLVHQIIQHFIELDIRISVKHCQNLAEEIVQLFPSESIDTYFVQKNKKLPPKGKLWDRYQGRKRSLKALSTINKKPKNTLEDIQEIEVSDDFECLPKNDLRELEEIATELKYVRDWEKVLDKWKQSFPYRKFFLQKQDVTLSGILEAWPLFKYSRAPELVYMDYSHLYLDKNFTFTRWEKFCQVAEILFDQRIKDPISKTFFKDTLAKKKNLNEDNLHICFLKLLHAVLIPTTKVLGGVHVKYTISDSQKSFTMPILQASDVDTVLEAKRNECIKNKSTLQPLIVIIGSEFNYKDFYVFLDDTKFAFQSYLESLQFCFKLMYVLNLKYALQSDSVWTFIQKYFFNIQDDVKNPIVDTFIKDINSTNM